VNEAEFLAHVRERGSLGSTEQARTATEATLRVLGSRITGSEAEDLAARLPGPLGPALVREREADPEPFDAATFVERVGEHESVGAGEAETHATAVASTLNDFVDDGLDGVRERLSDGYDRLFDPTSVGT
jgi:uncharacterized protein (DUF2267 family)